MERKYRAKDESGIIDPAMFLIPIYKIIVIIIVIIVVLNGKKAGRIVYMGYSW